MSELRTSGVLLTVRFSKDNFPRNRLRSFPYQLHGPFRIQPNRASEIKPPFIQYYVSNGTTRVEISAASSLISTGFGTNI